VSRPDSLTVKIKAADTELRNYVIELEKENLKLQQQIAKLQVKTVSQQNEIKALKKAPPKIKVVLGRPPDKSDSK
jgi:hypothetical protein